MQNVIDEIDDYSIYRKLYNWLVLDPFYKLVNGHQHVSETS
jgi:hypothetical protein